MVAKKRFYHVYDIVDGLIKIGFSNISTKMDGSLGTGITIV